MDCKWKVDARIRRCLEALLVMALVLGASSVALASGGSMPWDNVMESFQTNMAGKLARGIAIIMIVVVGFMVAKGMPFDGIAGKLIGVIMGISLMAGAPTFASAFGASGAVLPY